jgi:hypothetical protein
VVLLHSIRRLLLWIAVLLAILVVALVIVPRIVILFS